MTTANKGFLNLLDKFKSAPEVTLISASKQAFSLIRRYNDDNEDRIINYLSNSSSYFVNEPVIRTVLPKVVLKQWLYFVPFPFSSIYWQTKTDYSSSVNVETIGVPNNCSLQWKMTVIERIY